MLKARGQLVDAEKLYRRVLEGFEAALGEAVERHGGAEALSAVDRASAPVPEQSGLVRIGREENLDAVGEPQSRLRDVRRRGRGAE